ncbi:unnamed protein product [Brassica oleracea]
MSQAEKKQSPRPSSSPITSLPEDVVVDILARVPRRDYPRVSLVLKRFRSLVSSPEIYARRSSLGCTEHCLYDVLYNWASHVDRLYTLRQKEKDKGLVLIPGLPDMPTEGSFVAVGLWDDDIECFLHRLYIPHCATSPEDACAHVCSTR